MKRQVKSPLQILVEILVLLFVSSVEILILMGKLLYELYLSLRIMAYSNPIGLILAFSIGGIIFYFSLKYLLGGTVGALKIIAIYIIIVILLLTFFGGSFSLPQPPTNSTP